MNINIKRSSIDGLCINIKIGIYELEHMSRLDNGCFYISRIDEHNEVVWTYCAWWIGIDKII